MHAPFCARRLAALPWVALLTGCALGGGAPSADVSRLYEPERGPYAVRVDDSVTLSAADGRPVPVRIVYPAGADRSPLIVFSHGMFSSNGMYMPILEHWAARGYVVVAPDHLDAKARWQPKGNEDVERLATSRVADLSRVMDALPDIERAVPALAGRIAPPPYAAAGHSMGTYIAMLAAGLETRNPKTGAVIAQPDRRIGYVVMSSDPGKMALMPEDLWRGIGVPTFMTTGTRDYGVSGKGRRPTEYTMEVLSGARTAAGGRYRVLIQDGDHYYGGLVHRAPKEVEPDPQALAIFNALSTAFLDACMRGDVRARAYLQQIDLVALTHGRAELTIE